MVSVIESPAWKAHDAHHQAISIQSTRVPIAEELDRFSKVTVQVVKLPDYLNSCIKDSEIALFHAAVAEAITQGVFNTLDIIHLHDWHAAFS